MKLSIAADHGGFILKKEIVKYLKAAGHELDDKGVFSEESVDYPDFAIKVANDVASGKAERGILICGTGIGMSITANKVKGIRAALVYDEYTSEMSRKHNNANVLCMGGRTTTPDMAKKILDVWFSTDFERDRHQRRIDKISALE